MWNQHSSIEAFRSRWTNDWAVFELRSSSSEFHLRQDIQKGLPNTAKTGLGYKVWYWNVLKVGADHERMGSHWLSIYQRAMCLLSYRVRSCKSWWIFQQSWCLSFLWSRVLWTTLNIIESNKNRYDMIWLWFWHPEKREDTSMDLFASASHRTWLPAHTWSALRRMPLCYSSG